MFRSSATTIQLTPLLPACGNDPAAPSCNLLRLDALTLLLDCGLGVDIASSAEQLLAAAGPHLHEVDAVLLSSSELASCGGLPLLLPHMRPGVRVVATMATARLGIMNVVTHFLSQFGNADDLMHRLAPGKNAQRPAPPEGLSVRGIYAAFRAIRETQFNQIVTVAPLQAARPAPVGAAAAAAEGDNGADGVDVTASVRAVSAGRCVGGAGFRIRFRDDDILYVSRLSPRDSVCLPGLNTTTTTDGALMGANITVLDGSAIRIGASSENDGGEDDDATAAANNNIQQQQQHPSVATDNILKLVRETLRKGGTALLPLDAFGTGIELMHRLEAYFNDEGLVYPLVFACPKAQEHVERLRLLSEFSLGSAGWAKSATEGPLSRYQLVSSAGEVQQMFGGSGDKNSAASATAGGGGARCIVLHTHDCRDWISALLLQSVAKEAKNLILFSEMRSSSPAAFAVRDALVSSKKQQQGSKQQQQQQAQVRFTAKARLLLEGQELEAFLVEDRTRRDEADLAAETEAARQRELEAAAELNMLMGEDEDANLQEESSNNNKKSKTANNNNKKSTQQHPNMFVSSQFDVKKRVKPSVLTFPGDVAASSTRILHDFAELTAANMNLMMQQRAGGGGGGGSGSGNDNKQQKGQQEQKQQQQQLVSIAASFSEEDVAVYGVPVRDSDIRRFRRIAAETSYSRAAAARKKGGENGGDDDDDDVVGGAAAGGGGGGESRDEVPARIEELECVFRCAARVETMVATQWLDGVSLRLLLRNNCKTMRKLAFLHSTPEDNRALLDFCATEDLCKRGAAAASSPTNPTAAAAAAGEDDANNNKKKDACVFCPATGETIDLATAVYSCEIRMHPLLLQQISAQQRPVKTQSGEWQVAWVRGVLLSKMQLGEIEKQQQQQQQGAGSRRTREQAAGRNDDDDPRPILCPISLIPEKQMAAAIARAKRMQQENGNNNDELAVISGFDDQQQQHEAGSILVGELQLPQIERELIVKARLRNVSIELDEVAPLLVASNAVAIRGGNRLALEAVPSAAMFAARRAFRANFSHIL